jgi:hypothetical protein
LRRGKGKSRLTIHVSFLLETRFAGTNGENMEKAGILRKAQSPRLLATLF